MITVKFTMEKTSTQYYKISSLYAIINFIVGMPTCNSSVLLLDTKIRSSFSVTTTPGGNSSDPSFGPLNLQHGFPCMSEMETQDKPEITHEVLSMKNFRQLIEWDV